MAEERIPTFIKGFDEHLEGGIVAGSVVLIMGEPGTMKSSLAYSILHHNAKQGKNGLYVSLEQGRKSVITQMASLGMVYDEVDANLSILDLAILRKKMKLGKKSWMEVFKMYAVNLKKSMNYELLVIDSLTVLELLSAFREPRIELFEFFEWLRDMNITTFLPTEMTSKGDVLTPYGEDYLADAIVHMKMERVGDVNIQRRIRMVKLRATKHTPNFFSLLQQGDGYFAVTKVISEE
jgi:KaiC/GvpD/RAD55 family RecA-like ATPase